MNHSPQFMPKKLFPIIRGSMILGVFVLSMSVMRNATALDITSIAMNFVRGLGIEQLFGSTTSSQSNAVTVNTSQTALSASLLSNAIAKTSEVQAAVDQGIEIGKRVTQAQQDKQIGRGLPSSIGCEAIAEKQLANTRKIITDDTVLSQTSAVAASHVVSETQKRSLRTQVHLNDYCDVTESAQGICVLKADGMGGADTNYGMWASQLSLSKEQQAAAQNYIFNNVDPADTVDSKCDGSLCGELASMQREFNALSSIVHNAYLSQINDRVVLDTVPDAKAVISDTIKADKPAATGNTVKMPDSGANPSASAPITPASSAKNK